MFITRIRNAFTPLEWTILTLIIFLMLVATINFVDGVVMCGSEGVGPAAPKTC
jgi:hypothetical protein